MSKSKVKTAVSNQVKISQLAADLEVYSDVQLSVEDYGKIQDLRDRLDYVLLDLEQKGQKAKIKNMEAVLDIMKKAKLASV